MPHAQANLSGPRPLRREKPMQFHKTPIAMAVVAACGAMPLAANAAPTVSWNTPATNAVLSGTVSGAACAVTTSSDTTRATFWDNNWQNKQPSPAPFTPPDPTTQRSAAPNTLD